MILYVVRHGKTAWNLEHRCQGISDIPLIEEGREKAKELSSLVKTLDIDVVISSPLKRALETAKLLTNNEMPINIDDRLIERDWGMNEGMVVDSLDQIDCWDDVCFGGAIYLDESENKIKIDQEKCVGCGHCTHVCPKGVFDLSYTQDSLDYILDRMDALIDYR